MNNKQDINRYQANRQKEIDGAALYTALAERENQSQLAEVYRRMAAGELKHARVWEQHLSDAGVKIAPARPSWHARLMVVLARRFGSHFILPTVTGNERADSRAYNNPRSKLENSPQTSCPMLGC
jgi:hypothetical protein